MTMFFTNFHKEESYELTFQLAKKFAAKSGLQSLVDLVDRKDEAALVAYQIDYADDWDPISLIAARQCLALFTKRDDLNLGVDTEKVAFDKFVEAEITCKSTNARLVEPGWRLKNCFSSAVLQLAEEKISRVLGDLPSLTDLHLVFGPGAATTCRNNTTARWKLSTKPACSADMLSIVGDVLDQMPHYTSQYEVFSNVPDEDNYCGSEDEWNDTSRDLEERFGTTSVTVEIVEGRLMFVPKNAKTKRSIIVEPLLNSFLQKGYGQHLKKRLLLAGVNLYDQTVNQVRARVGSLDNSLATVDLSSASDTISTELVRLLLPSDWFWALNRARTSRVKMPDGTVIRLEKFSSMGNGFTFELESLIFWALATSVCVAVGKVPDVTVYGDDIICPSSVYTRLEEVFCFCGFSINMDKSYSDGPFRESCGADYYRGLNVRPFYQKTTWSPATLCAFHNFLVRGDLQYCFLEEIEFLLQGLPEQYHVLGPDGFGDGHLLKDDWNRTPYKRDRGWSGYVFDTFVKLARRVKTPCPGDRVLPTYSIYVSGEGGSDHFAVSGSRGEKRISIYTLGR